MPFDRTATPLPGVGFYDLQGRHPWQTQEALRAELDRRAGLDANPLTRDDFNDRSYFLHEANWIKPGSAEAQAVADYLLPEPPSGDVVSAAFRQDNVVGSFASSAVSAIGDVEFYKDDPNYDVFKDLEGFEAFADRFTMAFNKKAADAIKIDIRQELVDRQTLHASGWMPYIASELAANVFDPSNLIPGGLFVKGGKTAYSVGRLAKAGAVTAGVGAAVQEAGLQASQQLRTPEESAASIGGSIVLGGLLGATAGGVLKLMGNGGPDYTKGALSNVEAAQHPEFDVANDLLHEELRQTATKLQADAAATGAADAMPQSAGAAAVAGDTLSDLTIAGKAGSAVANATAKLNPLLRTLTSPSKAVREIASAIMETPVYLRKNLTGAGDTAAETAMHEYARGAVVMALEEQHKAFMSARQAGAVLSEKQFREEVGKAMRRGDRSDIPGVSAAAKAWRKNVIDPLKERAIQANMLPPDVTVATAESYFSRMWNRLAIEANEPEFRGVVRKWLSGTVDNEIARQGRKADARAANVQAAKDELELGILRRGEATRQRATGGEADLSGVDEKDVVNFLRRYNAGERPAQPESLSDWLRRQPGIYDPNGDLAAVYPELRKMPGKLRSSLKSKFNTKGGDGLDEIVRRAWEEGFLNDAATVRHGLGRGGERPSISDFLDSLQGDLGGERVVRIADIEKARIADQFDNTVAALDRMGVDFKTPKFATTADMKDLAGKVNRALDDLDRERIGRLNDQLNQNPRGKLDFLNDADRAAYIEEIIDEIYNNVTGRAHDGDLPSHLVITKRGPLKERTFNIPDNLVERFLDNDAELIGRRYARIMAADIELTERFGTPDMQSALASVKAEYSALRAKVAADKNLSGAAQAKAIAALAKREKSDIGDLEGVRDLLRGHYRPEIQHTTWARIGRAANTFNYMRALGGVVVASLSDAVRPAMVHGLTAYMRDGVAPLLRNLDAVKLSHQEAKMAGAISERWLASRLATLAEITDPYAVNSPFERFLDNAATGFTKMTGLLHWNDFQKGIASVMTQNRILKNAETASAKGFDALPARERAYMGFLGIGQGKAEDLGKLFAAYGETLDGVRVAHSQNWGDDAAAAGLRRAYRAAINKDVDSIIVTKGVGDVPLFANTPLGRALLQFKGFAMATNQRVLIRGLQEDTTRFVGGAVGMSTIGMFIYFLKQLESGREVSDNPGTWIAEGLDRSGIFALAFEVNNALEKVGAPGVYTAAQSVFPGDKKAPASRYAVRSKVGSFLGPSFGAATDVVGLLSLGFENMRRVATGQEPTMTEGDIATIRRLTPYASLPYWRWLIDGMLVPKLKEQVAQ